MIEYPLHTVVFNETFVLPKISKAGYDFLGWFDADNIQYTDNEGNSLIYWDKADYSTLYAHWEATEYAITYELGGGTNSEENKVAYTVEDGIILLYEPTKEGHWFLGWKDAEGNDIYYIDTSIMSDIAITAVWL